MGLKVYAIDGEYEGSWLANGVNSRLAAKEGSHEKVVSWFVDVVNDSVWRPVSYESAFCRGSKLVSVQHEEEVVLALWFLGNHTGFVGVPMIRIGLIQLSVYSFDWKLGKCGDNS